MSVPAENGKPKENSDLMKFPSFEGKDLDGKEVKSSTLFAGNTVTVVNFWFTTCSPCVGEIPELEALNKKLSEKRRRGSRYKFLYTGRRENCDFGSKGCSDEERCNIQKYLV